MIPQRARSTAQFYALDRKLLPRVLRESGVKVTAIGNNFFLLGYPQSVCRSASTKWPTCDIRWPTHRRSPGAALRYLQENRERSFFLQLHYDAPHWPYSPPPQFLPKASTEQAADDGGTVGSNPQPVASEPSARSYLAEAAYADAQIAQVLAEPIGLRFRHARWLSSSVITAKCSTSNHNHFVLALKQPTLYHHGWSAYDGFCGCP